MAAAAELPDAAVNIYVEDNSGNRIATGSGVALSEDGLIATDMDLVLAWLASEDNSLFVRVTGRGYFPMETLITIERDLGVAVFSVGASRIKYASPTASPTPATGAVISLLADTGGPEPQSRVVRIEGTLSNGLLEISAPVKNMFKGAPAIDSDGNVIGIAVDIDGKGVIVPIQLADALSHKEVATSSEQPAPDTTGIKRAKAAVNAQRAKPEDYLRLGVAYANADMPEKSIEAFKKAIELKPEYAEAYHGLGVAYASQQMYEEAVDALEHAVSYNPSYAEAYGNLGFLYDYLGKHDDAIASFNRAVELSPEYAEAYNGLGVSEARAQNYAKAIDAFKQALRLRPEFKQARFNLGLSYISMGDRDAALQQESFLRELDPGLADQLRELLDAGEKSEEAEGESDETFIEHATDEGLPTDQGLH